MNLLRFVFPIGKVYSSAFLHLLPSDENIILKDSKVMERMKVNKAKLPYVYLFCTVFQKI
jgi:hypothetical protein